MLAGVAVVWRLDWGWQIHFQGGYSRGWQDGCRLLVGGLHSSPCWPLHRATECPHGMASGFPLSKQFKRPSCVVFYDLASEVPYHPFSSILLVTLYRKGLHKDVTARRWGSLGPILEAGYHSGKCRKRCVGRKHKMLREGREGFGGGKDYLWDAEGIRKDLIHFLDIHKYVFCAYCAPSTYKASLWKWTWNYGHMKCFK